MTSLTRISVPDEASAWQLLDDAIHGKLPKEAFQLDFGDWAEFHLKFKGAKFDSSLTPGMMDAFIDLQNNIYRLFAKLYYNDARARILTNDQRKALEIMIKVSPGSSDLTAIFKDAIEKLTLGAINKMEAKHWVIILLVGILGLTSRAMWKDYLGSQSEDKKAELNVSMSKLELEKMALVAAAAKQEPHVISMRTDADEFRNKILKSARSADEIEVAGQIVKKEQAVKLVRKSRTTSTEVRLDGEYKIIKVDSSDIDHFTVALMDKQGRSFPAVLKNDTVSKSKNMERLQTAEWNRNYINLEINGREVRGEVTVATIMGIKDEIIAKR
jgi:hypothetical protein